MSTFVLLHGHYLGAWAWDAVAERLRPAGHAVETPTLAGMGESSVAAGPETGLGSHVAQVTALIVEEDLEDVVLVGHSYCGMVLAGVAAALGPADRYRVHRWVYLDAVVPRDGQRLIDFLPPDAAAELCASAQAHGGSTLPPPGPDAVPLDDAHERSHVAERLTPIPFATLTDRVEAPGDPAWALPSTYVRCLRYPLSGPMADQLRGCASWRVDELDAGHFAMLSHPHDLAEMLLQAAKPSSEHEAD